MDMQQQVVPYNNNNHVEGDYLDRLKPGYRFCPTDVEIIVNYLKRKIETGGHPQCRLYEVNIYNHDPQELADRHRACDGNWYFLTPRERKYKKGTQPSRKIKTGGFWRTSQKDKAVYDGGQLVGRKRSFAHYVDKDNKSRWLMHEYITNDPDLPVGTNGNKLSEWVLCKIYLKEANQKDDTNHVEQVENMSNQDGQNKVNDEPSPRRRRFSESNQANEHEVVQTQQENHLLAGTENHMLAPMEFMLNSNQELVHGNDTASRLTAPLGNTQNFQDQTKSVVEEGNFSFDRTSGLTDQIGYAQSSQDECNQLNEHEHARLQEENYHLETDVQIVSPMTFDSNLDYFGNEDSFDLDELLSTRSMDSSDFSAEDELVNFLENTLPVCDDEDQEATRPSNVI